MRKLLALVSLMILGHHGFAQCPFSVSLKLKGSVCSGSDTLVVSSANVLSTIAWYNGNTLDTTVTALTDTIMDPNGVTVAGGNGKGSAANQFNSPSSLFVDSIGNIYVPDNQNYRVQEFPPGSTSATNGVTVAGGNGIGFAANQFVSPESVYVDGAGSIYVADWSAGDRIQKFPPGSTSATNGVTVAGGNGVGNAANQLSFPTSVYVDGNGYIYVTDEGNGRIQKFPQGSISGTDGVTVAGGNGIGNAADQLKDPIGIYVDASGNVYVADWLNDRIQKFPSGSNSATNGITVAGGNGQGSAANQLIPTGVYIDGSGNVYVADQGNNRIQKFPPNSTSTSNGVTVAGGNGPGNAADQLNNPLSVCVDSSGDIYVSDNKNNRIQKFSPKIISTIDTIYTTITLGTYTAMVTDSAGCTITTNAVVISPPLIPKISIDADKTTVCAGLPITFTAAASDTVGKALYQWQVNGNSMGANSPDYTSSAFINGDMVDCIISNGAGCAADTSNSIVLSIKPTPVVGPANDVSIQWGQSITLNIPVTGDIADYLWSPSIGLSNDTIAPPLATPAKTTTYSLKVVSTDSCAASGTITVKVFSPIMIPSAFTPNGDGRNDVFYVLGGQVGDRIKDLSIYDRWGQRIFQVQNALPNDPSFGWDGNHNGSPQPNGTYVYMVTIAFTNGAQQTFKGTLVLMR